jgi:NADH-quinone oxidoreductase E subunit
MSEVLQTDNWTEVEAKCREVLTEPIALSIEKCRAEDPNPASRLIQVLHEVQDRFGYIAPEHIDAVAQLLQVPAAKVAGVATFYHFFRLQPRGKVRISVCMGTACYVKGAERIVQKLKEELGIDFGETTKDGIFTLEQGRCLGTCGLAPVIMIEDQVHGPVTPDQIPSILEKCIEKAKTQ